MKKSFLISLFIGALYLQCGFLTSSEQAIVEVHGLEGLRYSEVLDILNTESSVRLSQVDLRSWHNTLEKHPRISKVSIKKQSGILQIHIEEKKIEWLVQSSGKLYELDSNLKIISIDDVRSKWIPILSGVFKTNKDEIQGSSFLALIQQVNNLFALFPELKERISEVHLSKDGNIYIYLHYPSRMVIEMGVYLSNLQSKKLYSSIAYLENSNSKAQFMDLSGEDAFFY
ncbi:MAG: hypothetical protein MH321_17475 [Leptospiraceae bacterium]|nr:hypothetical protein [Leptospiraceae bacterium]